MAKSNVQLAIKSLREKHMIAARAGTATEAAGYGLTFLRIRKMGVPGPGTPPAEDFHRNEYLEQVRVPKSGTPPYLKQVQGVLIPGTPPGDQERDEGYPRARVDFDSIDLSTIDRLFKADPKAHHPGELGEVKRLVHGYSAKFRKDERTGGPAHTHPPDDKIIAQLLTIAPAERIVRLIYELMAERKEPGYSDSWYVTVAAKRILGIKPEELKQARAALRIVKRSAPPDPQPQTPPADTEKPDRHFGPDLIRDTMQRRATK
jgi:hypothetical protein